MNTKRLGAASRRATLGPGSPDPCATCCCTRAPGLAVVVVRYMQIREYSRDDVGRVLRLNRIALLFGCTSCLGMLIVGAFQVGSRPLHRRQNTDSWAALVVDS